MIPHQAGARLKGMPSVGLLPWPDRFEDFHDRIGITFESFRDELTGGWLFNYVEALQRATVRPVLYYFSARVAAPERFRHGPTGVEVCVLPSPRLHCKIRGGRYRYWRWRPLRSPWLQAVESYLSTPLRSLVREIRADGCRALLCHEYEYTRFDVAVAIGALLRVDVFGTYQGGAPGRSRLERSIRRRTMRRAAGFVIPSAPEAARVRREYRIDARRIAEIPNPVDVTRWQPLSRRGMRAELSIPHDARVVTWQGRVEIDKKGLDVLFEAWPQLCRTHAAYKPLLLLVGSGQDDADLRRLVDAAPSGTVRWIDRYITDRELLWRYLSAADIATLPSRREGFSVAVVEAMACALPVVAADTAGVVEALGEGPAAAGFVVPREDPEALAEGLGRLIADSGLAGELGARGRVRAETRFSFEAVGARLRDFLFQCRGDGLQDAPGTRPLVSRS